MKKKRILKGKKNSFTRSHAILTPGGKLGVQLKKAHQHTFRNRSEIESSQVCGCGNCARVFPVGDIVEWADGEETAICPYCGIDVLIGDASGIVLTEEFLREMAGRYF